MMAIHSLFRNVHMTVLMASHSDTMTSTEWSLEDLESAVSRLDQLMRQPNWDSVGDSRDAATRLVRSHYGELWFHWNT